jgi:hypothetical protein
MFSLMSLYFAYRRNVVVAERYMPALDEKAAPVEAIVEVASEAPVAQELQLAA